MSTEISNQRKGSESLETLLPCKIKQKDMMMNIKIMSFKTVGRKSQEKKASKREDDTSSERGKQNNLLANATKAKHLNAER
jgi:hypothetical protein